MSTLALLSWILAIVIVGVAAWHLVAIAVHLKRTGDALEKLAAGLVAVRDHTAPLKGHVGAVNEGLGALLGKLEGVRGGLQAIAAHVAGR